MVYIFVYMCIFILYVFCILLLCLYIYIKYNEYIFRNDYIAWETKNSAQLAQSFKDKFYHEHGLAVNYYRERKRYYRGISFNNLLIKCSYISNSKYSIMKQDRDYNQIMLWEKLIDFELKNKQNVPNNVFLPRMEYIFKKALMVIRNYPDIWFMYIDFTKKYYNKNINNIERISKIYIDACKTLPDCVLLHLNYCDYIELNTNYFKNKNKAKNYYLQLIAFVEHQLAKMAKAKDKKKKKSKEEKKDDDDLPNIVVTKLANLENIEQYSLVYIGYMHYLSRNEGQQAARGFFLKAVTNPNTMFYQMFIAQAVMELYVHDDATAALKIFQNGYDSFKHVPKYQHSYIQFLMKSGRLKDSIIDKSKLPNLDQIFHSVLPELNRNNIACSNIWDQYIQYRKRDKKLIALYTAEMDRKGALKTTRVADMIYMANKYAFMDTLPCSQAYYDTLIRANNKISHINGINKTIINRSHNNSVIGDIKSDINNGRHKSNKSSNINVGNNNKNNNRDSSPWMSNIYQNNNEMSYVEPDINELMAYKPGVRFFNLIGDDNDEDNLTLNEINTKTPKNLLKLLNNLPKPQLTQLIKINNIPHIVDVESLITSIQLNTLFD